MRRFRGCALIVLVGGFLAAGGCSPAVSALTKLQSGDIGSLSSVEWQSVSQLGGQLGANVPQISPTQADAIVKFLQDNNIQTVDQLKQLLDSGNVTVPPELVTLFG